MDAAHRLRSDQDRFPERPSFAPHPDDLANIFRLRPAHAVPTAAPREAPNALTSADIGVAMGLVRDAATVVREAEERARESEAQLHLLLERAAEEVKAAETRAQHAEERAADAEARAEEAEDWLRQIFATISHELPPRR